RKLKRLLLAALDRKGHRCPLGTANQPTHRFRPLPDDIPAFDLEYAITRLEAGAFGGAAGKRRLYDHVVAPRLGRHADPGVGSPDADLKVLDLGRLKIRGV